MVETKLGLALSGGGFRASLFHIGVLARLAETGLLKDVEVISCVSGGSIIGAYYYLHLKKLLEQKADTEIRNQDYIDIISEIERDFLTAVQKNIRVRAFGNIFKDSIMFLKRYSSSDRMAELYNKMLYSKFTKYLEKPADEPVYMTDLPIRPKDYTNDKVFNLKENNKPRTYKVPMIVLNATTLNTGRNWQFTAVNFGEQETKDEEYNKNNLLESVHYSQINPNDKDLRKYKKIPLSIAVAASACVPGIFLPLALTKLYPEVTPLLVDGGVYDNQGISAILYEGCTDLIISDASGQMDFKSEPGGALLNVLSRTNTVLMDRVRNLGIRSAAILNRAVNTGKVKILHLKQGLDVKILKPGQVKFAGGASKSLTEHGILKNIQEYLAHTRTDLDSFTDLEAYSLMFSGYKICSSCIPPDRANVDWKFLCVEDYMTGKRGNKDYDKQLNISKSRLGRAFLLMPYLIPLGILNLSISLLPWIIILFLIPNQYYSGTSLGIFTGVVIAVVIIKLLGLKFVSESLIFKTSDMILTVLSAPFLSILCSLYILTVNPLYLRRGRVQTDNKNSQ